MNIQAKVIEIINEDGDACANASNTGGMGGITPAQPSTNAGSTIGSDFTNGGGTIGSGDVGFGLGTYQKSPNSKKKKKKVSKFSKLYKIKQDWTKGADKAPKLKSWEAFNINKVTHLNGK